jgi:hypothetical protein
MINRDSYRTKMSVVQATMIRDYSFGGDTVRYHDQVIGAVLIRVARQLIADGDSIAGAEWTLYVDRQTREHVRQSILES